MVSETGIVKVCVRQKKERKRERESKRGGSKDKGGGGWTRPLVYWVRREIEKALFTFST